MEDTQLHITNKIYTCIDVEAPEEQSKMEKQPTIIIEHVRLTYENETKNKCTFKLTNCV